MVDPVIKIYSDYCISCKDEEFRVFRSKKCISWGISLSTYKTVQEARAFIDGINHQKFEASGKSILEYKK